MISINKIKYCRREDIDILKWNNCIEESANGLIYAMSDYLDTMAVNWDALVLGDYQSVMPLTWKRKYRFYYLYQPYFVASLGVFGLEKTSLHTNDFLAAVPKKFRYWHIKLNESNELAQPDTSYKLKKSVNQLLSLDQSYESIAGGYKRLGTRMIRKAIDNNIKIVTGSAEEVIIFYKNLYGARHKKISSVAYDNLTSITTSYQHNGKAKAYFSKLPGGEITAAYLVLVDDNFVYSLIGGSTEKGKDTGSFYLLTDAVIKDHASTKRSFRFEGSDIPGVASFNTQFGSGPIEYLQVMNNLLPFPLNLLKDRSINSPE